MHIEIIDNSGLPREGMQAAVLWALKRRGLTAEGFARHNTGYF